jgi:CBS domain-containing protein
LGDNCTRKNNPKFDPDQTLEAIGLGGICVLDEGSSDMKARDIMVTNVIAVGPEASVQQAAEILFKNRISALPVVDEDGELIGMISEGDLARRAELETDDRRSWWLEIFARKSKERLAIEYVKSHARRVKDLMTRTVITARPGTSVRDIAALLEKNRIKRVPIVAKGRVVGIVSRANLVQALAGLREDSQPSAASDAAIRKRVMARLKSERWSRHALLNATVQDGTVTLWGIVDSRAEKEAARVAAEQVAGVRAVENNVIVQPVIAEV